MKHLHVSSHRQLPTNVYEIPDLLSPHFTGRISELDQVKNALNIAYDNAPAYCALYGMPGLGKTQLALKYSILGMEEGRYAYIFWLSAATAEKLYQDFANMADFLCLPGHDNMDQARKLRIVRAWLEDSFDVGKWLLVLDNTTQENVTTLRDILPKRNSNGNILFTTRTETVADLVVTVFGKVHEKIALQPPNIDDALTILLGGAEIESAELKESSFASMRSLIKSVGSLPLAIDQAASFMKESGNSAEKVVEIYKTKEAGDVSDIEDCVS